MNAEVILPIVRNMLAINEQLEQAIASLKGLDTGHLTIASFASISRNWLPRAIHEFQVDYPGIEIELLEGGGNQEKFKNETGPKIAHILKDHNVDAVILTAG